MWKSKMVVAERAISLTTRIVIHIIKPKQESLTNIIIIMIIFATEELDTTKALLLYIGHFLLYKQHYI